MASRIVMPVAPIYRIPNKTVDAAFLVDRALKGFTKFESDRSLWIQRREDFYLGWDDYSTPSRKGLWEGSSNLRFPLTEIQSTALHALILQAIFFYYPLFYVDPQEEVSIEGIRKIELMMKYILERYANYNKGIYTAIDDWAWDLVTEGVGIFSRGWDIQQRRFLSIVKNPEFNKQTIDLTNILKDTDEKEFNILADQFAKMPYIEKSVVRTVFNGPTIVAEDPTFILFKGEVVDSTDLNEHTMVQKVCYFTREQLVGFRDSEFFDEEVVDQVLNSTPDHRATTTIQGFTNSTRAAKDYQTGVSTTNPGEVEDSWEFLRVFDTVSLNPKDKLSMPDRLEYYVRPNTRQLARWTYLDRVSANGKIPLHMAHLFRRPRRSTGRGMVQTMYNMNDTLDILINQQIDNGTLANNPMFGYKADSSFDPQEVRVEPGLGIAMDNPGQDIFFYRWGINPSWSSPVMATVTSLAQQLTAIGPNTVGMVGENVGPLRSTSGVNTLAAQANIIHEVVIKRVKLCISEMFEGLYMDCVQRMPDTLKITVTGQHGIPVMDADGSPMSVPVTREELAHRVHFGLYATSQSMNKQAEQASASAINQMLMQKGFIETGSVGPNEMYEMGMNFLRAIGTPNPERFIKKPRPDTALPLKYELQMIIEGHMPLIAVQDPGRAEKLELYATLLDQTPEQLARERGMVSPKAMDLLKKVIAQHEKYKAMVEKPLAIQNPTGDNLSPLGGQGPANVNASQTTDNSQVINENRSQTTRQEMTPPPSGTPGGEMNG